ncbi:MAG: DUF1804 family protein [Arenicellales bacterium]
MSYPSETRDNVRASYVYERMPLAAAAEKHNIPFNTVRTWKKKSKEAGDDWDRARNASRMAAGGLGDVTMLVMEDFVLLFQSTIDDLKKDKNTPPAQKAEILSRLSDAYSKTIKAAGLSDSKMAELSIAMKVLEEMGTFIRDRFPQHLDTFVEILEPFGTRVSEVFSG